MTFLEGSLVVLLKEKKASVKALLPDEGKELVWALLLVAFPGRGCWQDDLEGADERCFAARSAGAERGLLAAAVELPLLVLV